jgi:hypothetical protein
VNTTGSEGKLRTTLVLVLFGIGMQCVGLATAAVPEIDPASGASAIALLAGAILVIRGRRKS